MSNIFSLPDSSGRFTRDDVEAMFKDLDENPIIRFADELCPECKGEGDLTVPDVGLRACPDCCGTGKRLIQPEAKPGSVIVHLTDGR